MIWDIALGIFLGFVLISLLGVVIALGYVGVVYLLDKKALRDMGASRVRHR